MYKSIDRIIKNESTYLYIYHIYIHVLKYNSYLYQKHKWYKKGQTTGEYKIKLKTKGYYFSMTIILTSNV